MTDPSSTPPLRTGGCHCGAVRYEVAVALDPVIACNCSICEAKGTLLSFAPAAAFRLVQGEDKLTEYRFNTKKLAHLFCATCGVQPMARGTMPDGTAMVAVNIRTLDGVDLDAVTPKPFDGRAR